MARYVALLGGINVGGHRVTMDRLRAAVEALGHADVSTFIASGNVLFTAGRAKPQAIEAKLETHLAEQFGWPVPTFVRTGPDVVATSELLPFGAIGDGYTHMVVFCRAAPGTDIEARSTATDRFHVHGRDVHWLIHGGVSTSRFTMPMLARVIGPNTTRNVTTVKKLAALVHD